MNARPLLQLGLRACAPSSGSSAFQPSQVYQAVRVQARFLSSRHRFEPSQKQQSITSPILATNSSPRHHSLTSTLGLHPSLSHSRPASFLDRFSAAGRLRRQATAQPDSVPAQLALFNQLLWAESSEAEKELIGRYEELVALWDASGPGHPALLASDEAFKLYLRALASQAARVDEPGEYFTKLAQAPTKRAEMLTGRTETSPIPPNKEAAEAAASSPPPAAATPPSAISPATAAAAAAASATPAPSQPPAASTPPLSPAALVTALFSGPGGRGKGGPAKILSGGGNAGAGAASGSDTIRVLVQEEKSPALLRAAKFIFVTALYSFLLLSLLSLLIDSSGVLRATAQTTPFTPTAAPDGDSGGRGATFKDVHGVDEAKEELYEVVEFLKDPERFSNLGGRLPRGVLLTGPPGTGKTLLARAVAGEAGVNFFAASGSEFDEMYVGVGARRIRELFAAARKAAPAVIFIDELDAVGGKRSPKDQHYTKQTLNQLLVELDGFQPGEGVILIGATNLADSLDKALVRPGRFDRTVVVPLPDVRGRAAILKHHLRNILFDRKGVDISIIARGTIGFSGADLQAMVNQAAVKASADKADAVYARHFEWAKERQMMGSARHSAYVDPKNKLATAYHEGGHALVALYTPGAYPLQSITVVPRGNALGYALFLPEMDKNSHTLAEYRAKLDVAFGGRIAEELIYGPDNVTDGASSDISSATNIARNMVTRFGFSRAVGPVAYSERGEGEVSGATQAVIEGEVKGLVEGAQQRARELLTERRVELERLAEALMEHETLDLSEVKRVIKGEKIVKRLEWEADGETQGA